MKPTKIILMILCLTTAFWGAGCMFRRLNLPVMELPTEYGLNPTAKIVALVNDQFPDQTHIEFLLYGGETVQRQGVTYGVRLRHLYFFLPKAADICLVDHSTPIFVKGDNKLAPPVNCLHGYIAVDRRRKLLKLDLIVSDGETSGKFVWNGVYKYERDDQSIALRACALEHESLSIFLFESGLVSVNVPRNETGLTYLHYAAAHGSIAVVSKLLELGADPNALCEIGDPPMADAVRGRRLDVVQALLAAGANPNAERSSGRSMLAGAAYNNDASIVKALLDAGAIPKPLGSDSKTPIALEYARKNNNVEMIKALEEALRKHGLPVDREDKHPKQENIEDAD